MIALLLACASTSAEPTPAPAPVVADPSPAPRAEPAPAPAKRPKTATAATPEQIEAAKSKPYMVDALPPEGSDHGKYGMQITSDNPRFEDFVRWELASQKQILLPEIPADTNFIEHKAYRFLKPADFDASGEKILTVSGPEGTPLYAEFSHYSGVDPNDEEYRAFVKAKWKKRADFVLGASGEAEVAGAVRKTVHFTTGARDEDHHVVAFVPDVFDGKDTYTGHYLHFGGAVDPLSEPSLAVVASSLAVEPE